MKRTLSLFVLVFITLSCIAQGKHDMSVSYGLGSHAVFSADKYPSQFDAYDVIQFKGFPGAISLQYMYNISDKIAFGLIGTYDMSYYNIEDKSSSEKFNNNNISLMPAVRYAYKNTDKYAFYSKIGAGFRVRLEQEKTMSEIKGKLEKENGLAFQVSVFGVEYGNTITRGFIELGYGNQGFLQAGIKFSL